MGQAANAGAGSSRAFRLIVAAAVAAAVLAVAAPAQAAPPEVGFTASTSNPTEGGTSVDVTVELNALSPLGAPLQFTVVATGGTSSASDHDFTSPTNLQFEIGEGDGATRTIQLLALDDADDDDNETLVLTIQSSVGGDIIAAQSVHTVTIADDDDGFSVGFVSASSEFVEGDAGSTSASGDGDADVGGSAAVCADGGRGAYGGDRDAG